MSAAGDRPAIAFAHGEVLAVVAPDGVETAISAVMARHEDEHSALAYLHASCPRARLPTRLECWRYLV